MCLTPPCIHRLTDVLIIHPLTDVLSKSNVNNALKIISNTSAQRVLSIKCFVDALVKCFPNFFESTKIQHFSKKLNKG